jgi:hypothetical protein
VLYVAIFIGICALLAAWSSVLDRANERDRKLRKIRRKLEQKERTAKDE